MAINTHTTFKTIPIAPDYEISKEGVIRDKRKGNRVVKSTPTYDGYLKTSLVINGKRYFFYTHRLVAMTYLDNPNRFSVVNHKDGNKNNFSIDNLEWVSHSENNFHANRNYLSNTNLRSDNTIGATGVLKRNEKFVPYVNVKGKRYYGGTYNTLGRAKKVRGDMKKDLLNNVKANITTYTQLARPMLVARKTLDVTDDLAGKIDDYNELKGNKVDPIHPKNIVKRKIRKGMDQVPEIKRLDNWGK